MQVYFVPHVAAVGGSRRSLELGAKWLAERRGTGVPVILVPTLRQASFADIDELRTTGATHVIPKNFPPTGWGGGPVLAPWANDKVIESLECSSERITSVCVLKWMEEDNQAWLTARQAIDVTTPESRPGPPTIADGVVLVALEGLTSIVNLSTGLTHYSDRISAISRLDYLKRCDHELNAGEIVSWALANGWSPAGAAQLRTIVEGLNAGRRFQGWRRFRIADRGKLHRRWTEQSAARASK